jgi:hypothetical protein
MAQADLVGRVAPRDHDGVDVVDAQGTGSDVRGDLLAVAAAIGLALDRPDDLDGGAGAGEGGAGGVEIEMVVVVFDEDHDAATAQRQGITHEGTASGASVLQRPARMIER